MSNLVNKTSKGEHRFYRLAKGVFAKTDSHSTEKHPSRIDVKTGSSLVILPPSTGKEIEICEVDSASELIVASQDYIDAIARHNGRPVPRPPVEPAVPTPSSPASKSQNIRMIAAMLAHLDPDMGYEDWLHVLMATYYETGGSEEGFEIVDQWCSKGSKYKGLDDIRSKWNSFKSGNDNPITIATLFKMLEDKGLDWMAICSENKFEVCDYEVIHPEDKPATDSKQSNNNALDNYSLKGKSAEIEKNLVESKPLLGKLALRGQSTVFYAAPNSGKTLFTIYLLIEAIKKGWVDPSQVYYLNMDDDSQGLFQKLQIAEEYGFHMLAEGYLDFTSNEFAKIIIRLVENDEAQGVVIILDTLKKFINLMDKTRSSRFTKVIAQFIAKGGTVVALAHTNKHPREDGKPVPGGTSDIVDDFSCAYTLAAVSSENGEKVVEFNNIKRRGNVVETAAYSYCVGNDIPYTEILASVSSVDEHQLESLIQAEQVRSDGDIIEVVTACINAGVVTKMKLADAVAKQAQVSKRAALQIIEKYSGDDPEKHKWSVTVKARGAKVFTLLVLN